MKTVGGRDLPLRTELAFFVVKTRDGWPYEAAWTYGQDPYPFADKP